MAERMPLPKIVNFLIELKNVQIQVRNTYNLRVLRHLTYMQ